MRRTTSSRRRAVSILLVALVVLALIFIAVLAFPHRRSPDDALRVRQMAQFRGMSAALELVHIESGAHPPSDANDPVGIPYCGALKLTEALMGQDLRGFHGKSAFRQDGFDAAGTVDLYPDVDRRVHKLLVVENLKTRKGPYLPADNAHARRLADIYGRGNTGPFPEDLFVLCDVFARERPGGEETGMPILYYRANRLGKAHQAGDPNNIYNCNDNQTLVSLGIPGAPGKKHPLLDPQRFYLNTENEQAQLKPEPHMRDSFLLISAGPDGLYGTADDICNFAWKYRER